MPLQFNSINLEDEFYSIPSWHLGKMRHPQNQGGNLHENIGRGKGGGGVS